jgi:hypothetical protein
VRVGQFRRVGLLRFHGAALFLSLCGCDPNILLGARPVGEPPDAFSDAAATEDRSIADGAIFDSSAISDMLSDRGAIRDSSGMPDGIPDVSVIDTGVIVDSGQGNERIVDATPTIFWSADHETGDLSAWHAGGAAAGGGQYAAAGQTEVSRERARSGAHAVKLTIDTSDRTDRTARLYRRTVSGGAYYSAWFWFNQTHTPDEWWSIFLFRAQRDPNDIETFVNLWNLDVERPDGGPMTLSFYDHLTQKFTRSSTPMPLVAGQWTHIEAFFNYAPPDATRITVWQDGQLIFDLGGLGQAPSSFLYWCVGTGSNGLMPRVSTIYIDDAAIAAGRLWPGGGG